MADSRPAGCEETHASIAASESSSSIAPKPIQSDTSSTQSQDQYEPIPNGRWTLTFTGNCPKCHHHNKALQVQIQVSPGVSHVTYVRCEKCRDRWAAFGGGNSTRISLLSTTTTEPDHVQQGVRYSFVEIVKLMQERAKSGPLPESHSLNTRSQPPVGAGIKNDASAAPSSLDASVVDLDAKDAAHAELEPCQRSIEPTNSLSTEHTLAPPKRRNNALRLLSNFKRKITTRFPILKRHRSRQIAATYQPESSIRKLEKSTIQTLPAEGPKPPPSIHVLPTVQCQTELSDNFAAEIVEPSKRIAEVVAFIATLDKSELNSMSEQERTAWMRRKYTEFKIHRRRVSSPLVVPTILQTSTQTEPLRPLFGQPSSDLFGVGYHLIEGLEVLESALRRGSFTISETSEAQSMSDGTTLASPRRSSGQLYLQRLRQRLDRRRPQSSPYPLNSNSHLRLNMRNSADTLVPRDRDSNLPMHGQMTPSRLSQSTTMCTSTRDTVRPTSQETMHPESSDESNMESQESTPSPDFILQASPDSPRQV